MNHIARITAFAVLPSLAIVGLALIKAPMAAITPTPQALPPLPQPAAAPAVASTGALTATAALDRTAVLQSDGTIRVELTVSSTHTPAEGARTPTDLVVVMDRSGSMGGGNKIEDARTAARELLGHLDEQDRFSLVTYESRARVEIPLSPATDDGKARWRGQIAEIGVGGGTEMQQGLALGQDSLDPRAGRAQRVILISDGLPNRADGLLEQAAALGRSEAPLTTVGIGMDYDEQLMAGMADAGTGNFYWVQGSDDMAATFAREFDAARETVATSLQIRHAPGDAVALTEAAGYSVRDSGFAMGSLFASQERTLWLTLDVTDRSGLGVIEPGTLELSWRDLDGTAQALSVALPPVTVTADQDVYAQGFDNERWGRGILDEEYNRMRSEVSARVQAGDRDAALALIDSYYTDNYALNASLDNQMVSGNLEEVQVLRQEVVDNFTGTDQRARQNEWSKLNTQSAYQNRRGGQFKK